MEGVAGARGKEGSRPEVELVGHGRGNSLTERSHARFAAKERLTC